MTGAPGPLNSPNNTSGGGSGGTINIQAQTLSGSGTLNVSGGYGYSYYINQNCGLFNAYVDQENNLSGNGSGGMVNLCASQTNSFSGSEYLNPNGTYHHCP